MKIKYNIQEKKNKLSAGSTSACTILA